MNYTDKIYGKFVHVTCYANLRKNSFCQIKLSLSACTAWFWLRKRVWITKSQNNLHWKGPLEVIRSYFTLKADQITQSCLKSWAPPRNRLQWLSEQPGPMFDCFHGKMYSFYLTRIFLLHDAPIAKSIYNLDIECVKDCFLVLGQLVCSRLHS